MFTLIKQVFIALLSSSGSLTSMANVSNFRTCMSLNNQSCMTAPCVTTLIDLNHEEYNQGLRYYPFMVNLDRCSGSCNKFDYSSGRICVPNETENVKTIYFLIQ